MNELDYDERADFVPPAGAKPSAKPAAPQTKSRKRQRTEEEIRSKREKKPKKPEPAKSAAKERELPAIKTPAAEPKVTRVEKCATKPVRQPTLLSLEESDEPAAAAKPPAVEAQVRPDQSPSFFALSPQLPACVCWHRCLPRAHVLASGVQ